MSGSSVARCDIREICFINAKGMSPATMIRPGIALLSFLISSSTWAANQSQFAIKGSRQDSNGVTLRTAAGTMRIEVCGDRIVHVVATSRPEIPNPKVHIVTQPCHANNVKVDEIGRAHV